MHGSRSGIVFCWFSAVLIGAWRRLVWARGAKLVSLSAVSWLAPKELGLSKFNVLRR